MINRNVTRTIFGATETTLKTKSVGDPVLAFPLQPADYFYLGFRDPFLSRFFRLTTPSAGSRTLSAKIRTGRGADDWTSVEDLVDETLGFTRSGFIAWQTPQNWEPITQTPVAAVNDENTDAAKLQYYWLRMQVSVACDATAELQAVLNLFCDDESMRRLYPDIIADGRYLPPQRPNFDEQYLAGKDFVVRHLKQMGKIDREGAIIDPTDLAVAAAHATAYTILHPISSGVPELRARANDAYNACMKELERATFPVDQNKDGEISPSEENQSTGQNFFGR